MDTIETIIEGITLILFLFTGLVLIFALIEFLRVKTREINEKRVLKEAKKLFIELRESHKDDRELVGKFTELIDVVEEAEKK